MNIVLSNVSTSCQTRTKTLPLSHWMSVRLAERLIESVRIFRETTRQLGTTPSDALRMFVSACNEHRGFPYQVPLGESIEISPLETEKDAIDFATRNRLGLSMKRGEAWTLRDDGYASKARPVVVVVHA